MTSVARGEAASSTVVMPMPTSSSEKMAAAALSVRRTACTLYVVLRMSSAEWRRKWNG